MLGTILHFIVNVVFSLFGIALIVRAWMYAIRLHPFNPYSQAIIRATDWLIQPMRKIIPTGNRVDWPSIVACWLTAFVYLLLVWFMLTGQLPPFDNLLPAVVASAFTMLKWVFNVILWVTLAQVVLSWVNPLAPAMSVLHTLTAPLLDPIRRALPNLGGIDFSPLVLLIAAQIAMMLLEHFAFSLFGIV
jgi:YggT family protein